MNDLVRELERSKIVAIVRGTFGDDLIKLARALNAGGIRFLEVTFVQNADDCIERTAAAIRSLTEAVPEDMHIGAGTVLTAEQVQAAHAAGAQYIISPNVNERVIRRTKELGLVSIPGAMTPSEICTAHELGADIVKLFPFGDLGIKYVKDIRAPLSHIKLMATAGINEENLGEALDAGFCSAGVSGRLTDKKLIAEGNFAELARRASVFTAIAGSR